MALKQNQQTAELLRRIGEKLKARMWEKQMRIGDLSAKSGVTKVVIYRIFKGQGCYTTSLAALMVALDMDAELLK